MEHQEEKKRKVYRKSISTSSFPLDLTSEILLRLPARSVARFRCVSKLWLSITTDSYFINSFETRISTLHPSLLVIFREDGDDKLFVSSIPQQQTLQNWNNHSQPMGSYHTEFPKTDNFKATEFVHGLICFKESSKPAIVWNPSKRQFVTLTKPRKSWKDITILLGYDPIGCKHKVMCIPYYRISDVCRVLTLGSAQESWRTVKSKHKQFSDRFTSGICIKGVVYYTANVFRTTSVCVVLMSFDVRSEKFGMIDLPSNIDIYRNKLITYEGRLVCLNSVKKTQHILEDAENHIWSSTDFIESSTDSARETFFILNGITHAGELIYVQSKHHKSHYILFYDPVRKISRRFALKGIAADDKSRPSKGVYVLHTFPIHM